MTPTQARLAAERKDRLARIASRAFTPVRFVPPPEPVKPPEPQPVAIEVAAPKIKRDWIYVTDAYLPPTIKEIQIATCSLTGVRLMEMQSHRRARRVVRPRQIAMYLAKTLTPHSLPAIGRQFGNRDHTTILHGVRLIESLIETDEGIARIVAAIRRNIEERGQHEADANPHDRLSPEASSPLRQDSRASPAG